MRHLRRRAKGFFAMMRLQRFVEHPLQERLHRFPEIRRIQLDGCAANGYFGLAYGKKTRRKKRQNGNWLVILCSLMHMNEQWTGTTIKAFWLHFFVLFLLS